MNNQDMGLITVQHQRLTFGPLRGLPHHRPIVELALTSYRHVLFGLNGKVSYGKFADLIEAAYDCTDNPNNREVVRMLREVHKCSGSPESTC